MKFQLDRETLLGRLQTVAGAVERREKLPILGNVKVVLEGGVLSLSATDMEVELVAEAAVPDGEDGETTVPALKWMDICRTLPEDAAVEFTCDEKRAQLRAGRSRFALNTLPAADYPPMDSVETQVDVSLARQDLRQLIERTHFAMANQDVRYYLNGLLFEFQDRKLRAVATDGHRLAQAELELAETVGEEARQCILPRKGVLELLRLLQGASEGDVGLKLGGSSLQAAIDGVTFTSRLVEGKFPDYNRVIPREDQCDRQVEADREQMRRTLQRVAVLTNEKHRTMRLSFSAETLHVAANNTDQEEAEDEVDVQFTGEALDIGFNSDYLIDALGAIPSERVTMLMSDASSSCLLTPKEDDGSCRYVVMPMRL